MRALLCIVALSALTIPSRAAPACPPGNANFAPFYPSAAPFEKAIASAAGHEPSNERLTGITVPHHLTADHLIALGFRAASGFAYKRIILLSPDHFFQSAKPVATSARGFDTVLGSVTTDAGAVHQLLATQDLVEDSCLFAREHGVLALLPFLHHYFPDTPIVPVAISIKAGRPEWDRIAAALRPLVDADTLIVESTDFSHYLPQHVARGFDQQTLNILASGSPDAIPGMRQPDHADSLGALYVQMMLQRQVFGAAPLVVANENMQEYSTKYIAETTSYLVVLFSRFDPDFNNPATGREKFYYFAGDTMFGRAMTKMLLDEEASQRIAAAILARTKGRPLIVNLEGVILPDVPDGLGPLTLVMPEELARAWLTRLNVAGAGLANNHALDLGPSGYAETVAALRKAGIPAFGQGETLQLPGLDIVGLTDFQANGPTALELITPALIDRLARPDASKPVVAFVHWGREYNPEPGPREKMLADRMRLSGVSAIVGAHPHVASPGLAALGGGDTLEAYSLGNFLFDQTSDNSSGSLLELRVFGQGTFFARLIPLPNLFELGGG